MAFIMRLAKGSRRLITNNNVHTIKSVNKTMCTTLLSLSLSPFFHAHTHTLSSSHVWSSGKTASRRLGTIEGAGAAGG